MVTHRMDNFLFCIKIRPHGEKILQQYNTYANEMERAKKYVKDFWYINQKRRSNVEVQVYNKASKTR